MEDYKNNKRYIIYLGIFLSSFLIRIIFLYSYGKDIIFPDIEEYNKIALHILSGKGYLYYTNWPYFRAPLFPHFLSLIYYISPLNTNLVKLINILLDSTTCIIIFLITKKVFNKKIGITSAIIYCFYPFFIYHTSFISRECILIFILSLLIYLFTCLLFEEEKNNVILYISTGFIAALCLLVRPDILIVITLFFIIYFLRYYKSSIKPLKTIFIIFLVMIMTIVPWSIKNYLKFNKFILISNSGGANFWFGNNKDRIKIFTIKDREEYGKLERELIKEARIDSEISKKYGANERLWYNEAFKYLINNKKEWLKLWIYKFAHIWNPSISSIVYPRTYVIISFLCTFPIWILGTLGLIASFKRKTKWFCLIVIALFIHISIIGTVFVSKIRYRIPIFDPYYIILASVGIYYIIGKISLKVGRTEKTI